MKGAQLTRIILRTNRCRMWQPYSTQTELSQRTIRAKKFSELARPRLTDVIARKIKPGPKRALLQLIALDLAPFQHAQ